MPELGDPISERELDVLNCLAEGASNREIAQQLSISHNTVKVHIRNIFTKFGVSSRTEAATLALQRGVVTIPGIEVDENGESSEAAAADDNAAVGDTESGESPPAGSILAPATAAPLPEPTVVAPVEPPAASPAVPPRAAGNRRLIWLVGFIAVAALLLAGAAAGSRLLAEFGATATPPATPTRFVETRLEEKWLASVPLPAARADMAVASVGLSLYQIGGETSAGVDNAVAIYDTQTYQWREGAPKLTAVAGGAATVLDGEIYVIGGRGENGEAVAAVEAYSPLNDGWRPITPLPQPVAGGVAFAHNGQLYLVGGAGAGGDALDTAFRFDPAGEQWQALPSLAQPRAEAVGGVLNGQLVIAGGTDGSEPLDGCERLDVAAAAWERCAPMLAARSGAGAAVLLNRLYVLGGAAASALDSGEVYDPETDSWEPIAAAPLAGTDGGWPHLGVANVETRIYALGGRPQGALSDQMVVYTPLAYQFFIPAASGGGS